MTGSHTIKQIAAALLAAQRTMGDATKGAKNPFFKSTYADLNSIREVVIPNLNSQGISVLQPTTTLGDRNYVETILLHESGEFLSGLTEIKNTDGKAQSEGSGISYARRYGLQSMLNVGAVDDDGEAAQGRAATQTAAKPVLRAEPVAYPRPPDIAIGSTAGATNVQTKDLITGAFKVLEAQKKISKEAFKTNYLGNRGLSAVLPSEYTTIYEKMKKDFPHLNGAK